MFILLLTLRHVVPTDTHPWLTLACRSRRLLVHTPFYVIHLKMIQFSRGVFTLTDFTPKAISSSINHVLLAMDCANGG